MHALGRARAGPPGGKAALHAPAAPLKGALQPPAHPCMPAAPACLSFPACQPPLRASRPCVPAPPACLASVHAALGAPHVHSIARHVVVLKLALVPAMGREQAAGHGEFGSSRQGLWGASGSQRWANDGRRGVSCRATCKACSAPAAGRPHRSPLLYLNTPRTWHLSSLTSPS